MQWLIEPFSFGFMRSGLLASVLIGLICATLGVYVVLRGMSFIGDALAHTILPGVVLAYMRGWNVFLGAIVAGLITAVSIGWVSRRQEVREDTAIGVLFTGMFALGIMMMSSMQSFRDFSHILFGNVLGVTTTDLLIIGSVAVVLLLVLGLFHKELELSSYDPTHAEVIGIGTQRLRMLLLVLLAFAVVSSIQVVGVVLTSAMLVTPAAAASLVTKRLPRMMLVSTLIAVGSSVVGLYVSYYANVSSGAAIVLTCTACFGAIWLYRMLRMRLSQ